MIVAARVEARATGSCLLKLGISCVRSDIAHKAYRRRGLILCCRSHVGERRVLLCSDVCTEKPSLLLVDGAEGAVVLLLPCVEPSQKMGKCEAPALPRTLPRTFRAR